MRGLLTLASALCLLGCFSGDDFEHVDPFDPNAPQRCGQGDLCDRVSGSVRVCVLGNCKEPPIVLPNQAPIDGPIRGYVYIAPNDGTYYVGDVQLLSERNTPFTVEADDIVFEGEVRADPSVSNSFEFRARRSMWIKNGASFVSNNTNVAAQFLLHSQGKMYIDNGAGLDSRSACVCRFADMGDENTSMEIVITPDCGQGNSQCVR